MPTTKSSSILDSWSIKIFHIIASICSVSGFIYAIVERSPGQTFAAGWSRLNVILYLSITVSIGYGALWTGAERIWNWSFGSGGGHSLPQGWSSIVLSLCLTIPLAVIPAASQAIIGTEIVLPAHWKGAFAVIFSASLGNLVLHGISPKIYDGLRRFSMSGENSLTLDRAVGMEAIYSIVHMTSIVLVYRLIVDPSATFLGTVLSRTLLPTLVYFFSLSAYIIFRYPGSVNKDREIEVRGFLAAMLIALCSCSGMFL
jgi:hypothetical protein